MPEYVSIKARLPHGAGLELSARLLAARPHWDIELDGEELFFTVDLIRGQMDSELRVVEEACRHLECVKNVELRDFWVERVSEPLAWSAPASAGPWRLLVLKEGEAAPAPRPDRLALPPESVASARFWAGESLSLTALADILTPPPGAPETRGKALLALGHTRPLVPVAALLAGAAEVTLISDAAACEFARTVAALNGKAAALCCECEDFNTLAKNKTEWTGRFSQIALHLSPYLAVRYLKTLAAWLAEDGVIIISGFAPGPQTAQLLRSAARAGLLLAASSAEGAWALMRLKKVPAREELPPLTGSVVPALRDLPPEELAAQEEEIPDEESLILDEEETEEVTDDQEA